MRELHTGKGMLCNNISSIRFFWPPKHIISETAHSCHIPCQFYPSSFCNPDIIWWTIHLIMQCNALSTVITQCTYFTQWLPFLHYTNYTSTLARSRVVVRYKSLSTYGKRFAMKADSPFSLLRPVYSISPLVTFIAVKYNTKRNKIYINKV
jgi:hypothetical protein